MSDTLDLIPLPDPYTGDGLAPAVLGVHVVGGTHVRLLGDPETGEGTLYAYDGNGLWVPCTGDLRRGLVRALGNRWRSSHDREVVKWATLAAPPIQPALLDGRTLNFRNGFLDVPTGEFEAHTDTPDPDYGDWTIQLPYDWTDPDDAYWKDNNGEHRQTFPDPDMYDFIHEVIGYLLLKGNPYQHAFMFYGRGATGKSTLMSVLSALLGPANVSAVDMRRLLGGNQFNGSLLIDKMLNLAGEVNSEMITNSGFLKALTGGDPITVERKGKDAFLYTPFAKHVFAANDFPMASDVTDAMLRRFVIVPFDHVVPPEKREREDELRAKLTSRRELESLVVDSVLALQRLLERGGFQFPDRVLECMGEFAEGMSDARGWLRERAVLDPTAVTKASDAWRDYRNLYSDGRPPLGRNEFYSQLREVRGLSYGKNASTKQREITGLALRRQPTSGGI
jgi:P4 family phage/plasmid primase-like protien